MRGCKAESAGKKPAKSGVGHVEREKAITYGAGVSQIPVPEPGFIFVPQSNTLEFNKKALIFLR